MLRRAVGITDQSEKHQQIQSTPVQYEFKNKLIPGKHHFNRDFDDAHKRYIRSIDDESCRCCT
jgi:hypothetical protein